jgi:hypothetical protein
MSGVVHVEVDRRTNQATVEHLPEFVDVIALIAAIRDAGYSARVTGGVTATDGDRPAEEPPGCGCGDSCGESRGKEWWTNLGTSTVG